MKITLTEAQTIKSRDYDVGDEVIVKKDFGERLIKEGLANLVIDAPEDRVVEEPENRMTPFRFSGHKTIFQGTDGKKYVKNGKDYVEAKG